MTASERRLQAEWDLLQTLALLNPGRIDAIAASDRNFHFALHQTPAYAGPIADPFRIRTKHTLRVFYPYAFPTVPLELYMEEPVWHPNIHPETGFICLWDRHRITNTVEHALHKVVAMMAGTLYNQNATHLMQPDALTWITGTPDAKAKRPEAAPLVGIEHEAFSPDSLRNNQEQRRRQRLS